jgi:hypothetical protein
MRIKQRSGSASKMRICNSGKRMLFCGVYAMPGRAFQLGCPRLNPRPVARHIALK